MHTRQFGPRGDTKDEVEGSVQNRSTREGRRQANALARGRLRFHS
jgi:hypothetical protein